MARRRAGSEAELRKSVGANTFTPDPAPDVVSPQANTSWFNGLLFGNQNSIQQNNVTPPQPQAPAPAPPEKRISQRSNKGYINPDKTYWSLVTSKAAKEAHQQELKREEEAAEALTQAALARSQARSAQSQLLANTPASVREDTIPLAAQNICSWTTVELANNIFGPSFLEHHFSRTDSTGDVVIKKVRGLWDFENNMDATPQCVGAIKDEPTYICWLCGLETDPTDSDLIQSCDHVLPIAQAVMFLGLFRYPEVLDTFIKELKTYDPSARTMVASAINDFNTNIANTPGYVIKMEYAWSHRCCNIVKNNSVFIEITDPRADIIEWKVNSDNIRITLDNLLTDSRCVKLKKLDGYPKSKNQLDAWYSVRKQRIIDHKIQNILNHLNSKPRGLDQLVLESKSRCIAIANPKYSSKILTKKESELIQNQVNTTAVSIFGDFPQRIIPGFILSPIRAIASCLGRTCRGRGRNKKRNKKTRRVKKH
jgi:hypothetical protein